MIKESKAKSIQSILNSTILRGLFTFCLYTIIPNFASAQATNELSIEQCMDLARQNNPDYQQALLKEKIAGNNLQQSLNNYLPSVNAYGRRVYNWGLFIDPATNILSNFNSQVYTGSLIAEVDLFNGGLYHYTVQQNKALRQSAAMDAQAVLYNLSLNVIQYYYQALMAQEVIVIAQRQLAQSQKLYTAVKKQIDAGLMTTRDLLNMESQVSQKETDLFQSETQLKQAYNNLKQLLNISSNEPIKLKTVSLNSLQIQPNILDSNFNLPQLKSLEFQLLAADQSIEMAAAAKYPVLSLSAGLTTRSSNLIQLELGQQFSNNLSKTIAFSLRVPLFNKFQNDMNIRNAQLNKQLLALQVKSFKNQQYNKQRNLVLDVENDRKNLDNLAKQQNYLDKELAFAEKSFQLGTSTYNEYFQVQTRNQNVQIDRLKAQINLQYKLLLFDTYQGSK